MENDGYPCNNPCNNLNRYSCNIRIYVRRIKKNLTSRKNSAILAKIQQKGGNMVKLVCDTCKAEVYTSAPKYFIGDNCCASDCEGHILPEVENVHNP